MKRRHLLMSIGLLHKPKPKKVPKVTWSNQQQDTLTLGPSPDSSSIVLTDDGQFTGGPEIDFNNSEGDLGYIVQESTGTVDIGVIASNGGGQAQSTLFLGAQGGVGSVSGINTQGEILLSGEIIVLNSATTVTDGNGNLYRVCGAGIQQVTPNTTTGQFTIPHTLGQVPSSVNMNLVRGGSAPGTTQPAIIYILSVTSTTITGYIVTLAGTLYTGGALLTIHWLATA